MLLLERDGWLGELGSDWRVSGWFDCVEDIVLMEDYVQQSLQREPGCWDCD